MDFFETILVLGKQLPEQMWLLSGRSHNKLRSKKGAMKTNSMDDFILESTVEQSEQTPCSEEL